MPDRRKEPRKCPVDCALGKLCHGLDQDSLAVGCASLGEPASMYLPVPRTLPSDSSRERYEPQFVRHQPRARHCRGHSPYLLPLDPLHKPCTGSVPRARDPEGETQESSPVAARARAETHIAVLRLRGLYLRQHMSLLLPPRKIGLRIRLRSQGQGWARV